MPDVVGLAVMTDTDDTEGRATAWYSDVVLHLQTGSSLSVPFDGAFDEQGSMMTILRNDSPGDRGGPASPRWSRNGCPR